MTHIRLFIVALALVFIAFPASAQSDKTVLGTDLRLDLLNGLRIQGELLAVNQDSLWLSQSGSRTALPMSDLQSVRRRVSGPTFGTHMIWAVAGGLISGLALSAACGSVDEGDCGGVLPGVMVSWGLVGLVTGAVSGGRWRSLDVSSSSLTPYARYPQGFPPAFDPETDLR